MKNRLRRVFQYELGWTIVLVVLTFFAGAWLNHRYWLFIGADGNDRWAMLGAFSELLAAAAIFSGFYLNYRSRDRATRIENLDLIARMFDKFNAPDQIDARTWVYQRLPKPYKYLSQREKDYIKLALNTLDEIALYFQISEIDDEAIMRYINPMVVKSWARLAPYVLEQREMRQEADYYIDAERLALRCIAWRSERYGSAEIEWIDPKQAL